MQIKKEYGGNGRGKGIQGKKNKIKNLEHEISDNVVLEAFMS